MRRTRGTLLASLALVAGLVAGCSGGADSGTESSAAGGRADAGGGARGGAEAAPDAVPAAAEDRQVVTAASASLSVDDPAATAQRVSELVEAAGGRIEERTEQAPSPGGEGGWARLVARVPAEALTGVLAGLRALGPVAEVSVTSSDVTAHAVDLDARIGALQTSVGRLQGLLDGAATTADLLEAEQALSQRQAELESLQSQRALLASQVELSTLTVSLQPAGVAPAGGPGGFTEGLSTGWRALLAASGAALVVAGVLLPWAVAGAVVAAAVVAAVRFARRRRAAA